VMISSHEKDTGFHLYMVEPNGNCYEYYTASQGKGRQFVKTEVEKNNFAIRNLTCTEGIKEYLKVVMRSFEGEKETEYDISYISVDSGFQHKLVERNTITNLTENLKIQIAEDRKNEIDS